MTARFTDKVFDAVAVSANETVNSREVYTKDYDELTLYLDISSYTDGTLDLTLQCSPDDGTTWFDHPSGAFAQQSAAGKVMLAVENVGNLVRLERVSGAVTTGFTFSAWIVGKRRGPKKG